MNKSVKIGLEIALVGTAALVAIGSIPRNSVPKPIAHVPALVRMQETYIPIEQTIEKIFTGLPSGRSHWNESNVYFGTRQWKEYDIFDVVQEKRHDTTFTSGSRIEINEVRMLKSLHIMTARYTETQDIAQGDFYCKVDTNAQGKVDNIDFTIYYGDGKTGGMDIAPIYTQGRMTGLAMCGYIYADSTCERQDTIPVNATAFTIAPLPFVFNDDGTQPTDITIPCEQSNYVLALPQGVFKQGSSLTELYKHVPQ